jgi:two-component system cell cycle response regulator
MTQKEIHILLVDDDPGDVDMVKEAFKTSQMAFRFDVVEDGVKALNFLRRKSPYQDAATPDLLLLDINLPKKDGREVLKEIKADETLHSLPVIVLTTSDAHTDLVSTYGLDTSHGYIIKPSSFAQFGPIVNAIEEVVKGKRAADGHFTLDLLLIEDDPGDAEWLQHMLSEDPRMRFKMRCAPRLQAGLDAIAKDRPHLVLLDLALPDSQGLATFTKLHTFAPTLPVIVLTGLADDTLAVEAVRKGAQDYLVKGELDVRVLTRVIRYALERNRMQAALRNLSLTDELTGLYNRRGFLTLATERRKLANRNGETFMVFLADLDGLKPINDTHGHGAGDQALKKTAQILRECFRTSDIIARIGGDEFAIATVEDKKNDGEFLRTRLQEALETYNAESQLPYRVGVSMGVARAPAKDLLSIEQLMAKADEALYQEKKAKRGPAS